ncbi:MAG: leukotriene A4 hydrolase C-terminal domain-containing protein [Pyrinomonadaceae bacterium]|nr:leukotriene A4 hydrolase C-terminal domain-containing protein [Pyrinomonadaceae bacterium]
MEDFLTAIGRRKFIRPLYAELIKPPEGRERVACQRVDSEGTFARMAG